MKPVIDLERVLHRSMLLTVSCASLILSSAEEARWPAAFTPIVALLTYAFVDRKKKVRLSVAGANLLGIAGFTAMAVEFYGNTILGKLLSGAHLLVYMTWVVLMMRKGVRQFWWLAALCALQLSVASVLTNSASFGASLIAMLLIMIWTLAVFTLYRARIRIGTPESVVEDSLATVAATKQDNTDLTIRNGLQIDAEEPWIGWRFCGMTGFAFMTSLVISVITFAVFPRFWVHQPLSAFSSLRQALPQQTGFTEAVELGEIGEIMQSNQRVLQFSITRMRTGSSVHPDVFADALHMDEIMFRGNALGRYLNGRWFSGRSQATSLGDLEELQSWFHRNPEGVDFRIRITQDPPIATFAFAPMPVTNAEHREGSGSIRQRRLSYCLVHRIKKEERRSEPLAYEVWCKAARRNSGRHSPGRNHRRSDLSDSVFRSPADSRRQREYQDAREWCITRNLQVRLPQLAALARTVCSQDGRLVPEESRVERIREFLSGTDDFSYSLVAAIDNPSIDPIEDFLLNRKSGHCEYFASAGALMLQAVDIPARVVNGYKGCELNSVTGRWEVRQKHAHTWVEVFVDGRWQTVDPTPAARDQSVSREDPFSWWTDLTTAMGDSWFSLVQKMSLQRQQELVRPLTDSARNAWETIQQQGLWASIRIFFESVVLKPDRWISWQFWVLTFFGLLVPALLLRRRPDRLVADLFRRLLRLLRRQDQQQRTVVRFYENFCRMCASHGLTFPGHQTACENAAMAATHFHDRLTTDHDRQLPAQIASTFNAVRFGGKSLSQESIDEIRGAVLRLGRVLKQER